MKKNLPPPPALRHKWSQTVKHLVGVLAFLLSAYFMINCAGPTPPSPEVRRTIPKKTDPEKQEEKCQAGTGDECTKDKKCKTICDDLFSRSSHEATCLELPKKTVLGFEKLFETLEEEDPEDLDLDILECLLDIDDTEFTSAVKKLPRAKAKDFLIEVIEDKDLARILEEEDDEFNILKQVFSRAMSGYKLKDVLTEELKDDKSFFHIVAEDKNEHAYKWIDEYVEEVCEEKRDSLQCPGEKREKIGAYCKAFVQHYSSELRDFLSSADLFEDDYRKKLEREDHKWTVTGFKDFCRDEYNVSRSSSSSSTGSTPATPCPNSDPPAIQKLATITFLYNSEIPRLNQYFYRPALFYTDTNQQSTSTEGSSVPSTINVLPGIIARTDRPQFTQVWLKTSEIPGFDFNNSTWYIYVAGTRYTLTRSSAPYTGGDGATYQKFSTANNINIPDANPKIIHLAYQPSGGSCTYITQP